LRDTVAARAAATDAPGRNARRAVRGCEVMAEQVTAHALSPEASARLVEFARSCKTAARAVSLYPPAHPPISGALQRLAQITASFTGSGPFRVQVTADRLLLDGSGLAKPDAGSSTNRASGCFSTWWRAPASSRSSSTSSSRSAPGRVPTERILSVLKRSDGRQFEQHLIRRFVQLLGIYPPGNLVRLRSAEIAVVISVHAPDPYRPRVRVIVDRSGTRLHTGMERNMWETPDDHRAEDSILEPVDPAEIGIDPLTLLPASRGPAR
jgi:hypothetical protein